MLVSTLFYLDVLMSLKWMHSWNSYHSSLNSNHTANIQLRIVYNYSLNNSCTVNSVKTPQSMLTTPVNYKPCSKIAATVHMHHNVLLHTPVLIYSIERSPVPLKGEWGCGGYIIPVLGSRGKGSGGIGQLNWGSMWCHCPPVVSISSIL